MNTSSGSVLDRVLYRDGLIIILDKPAGLPVHGGPGGGDHLELYLDALRFGLAQPPGLGHRLDRDTSGCLALGRHRKALRRLGRIFSAGLAEKTYWALLDGVPAAASGCVTAPLHKVSNARRGWRMVVDTTHGKASATDYRVRASDGRVSFVEFTPRTGRTHQIRVHAAELGCPVIGDPIYGRRDGPAGPLQLHAHRLVLPLYEAKPAVVAAAPPPPYMAALLARLPAACDDDTPVQSVP